MILYMYIAPGQRQTAPRGQNFDVNRNVLSLHSFVKSFKKCLWSLILYNLIHVYSPGAGSESPQGTKFWCQQEGLITLPICCKFQRNLFEVWFYTFFSWFNTYIASGQEHTAPQWTKFWCQQKLLVTSVICCQFQIIDDNSFWKIHCFTFFPYKSIRDQIWPCRKIGQG